MNDAGKGSPQGLFWPIFPIVGWGIAVVINGFVAYRGNIYTEEQISASSSACPTTKGSNGMSVRRPRQPVLTRTKGDRAFRIDVTIYAIVNALLLLTWVVLWIAGATDRVIVRPFPHDFFYPVIPIVVWGTLLADQGLAPRRGSRYTQELIEGELKHVPH